MMVSKIYKTTEENTKNQSGRKCPFSGEKSKKKKAKNKKQTNKQKNETPKAKV